MSGDTGLLLVTEAENICQNVINMGLVTITMRRPPLALRDELMYRNFKHLLTGWVRDLLVC